MSSRQQEPGPDNSRRNQQAAPGPHDSPLVTRNSRLSTRIVTAAEMKRIEAEAGTRGVPEAALMATAGEAVAAASRRAARRAGPAVVLVGAGNNGGDALVAARH